MKRTLAIAGLLAAASPAFAQFSGAELQRYSQSSNRELNIAALYFVGGIVDQTASVYNYLSFTSKDWDRKAFFCPPDTVKLGEIYAVVKAGMVKPEVALTEPAATHVTVILRKQWPCVPPAKP